MFLKCFLCHLRGNLKEFLTVRFTDTLAFLVKDIQDSHVIRVILDVNLPPDIVTQLIRAVLISPLGDAYVADKHVF